MNVPLALPLVRASAVLVLVLGIGGTAHARHHGKPSSQSHGKHALAEGRYHLKKANAYAGANKCWSAIPEYTAAYVKLADPVVLFNRADCYRRVGENERAIADYREFLKALPKASNRTDVEARIAALDKAAVVQRAAEAPPKEPPKKEQPKVEEKPPPPVPEPAHAVVVAAPPPPEQAVAPELLAAREPTAAESPALLAAGAEPVVVARAGDKPKKRGYWWVWVLAGAVAAGGGATAFLILRPHPATIPPTELGNYHF